MQRPRARGLDAVGAIALAEADDAQRGAEALLGVGARGHDRLDERGRRGPGRLRPGDDAAGVQRAWRRWDSGMCAGSVVWPPRTELRGCEATRLPRRRPRACAAVRRSVDELADELIGHGVVVAVELDVVVDVDLGGFKVANS